MANDGSAFDCFGSSSSDEESSRADDVSRAEQAKQLEGTALRDEHNRRHEIAEKMRYALPITSPDFEVFQTTMTLLLMS